MTGSRLTIFCSLLFIFSRSILAQPTGNSKEDFLYGEFFIEQGLYAEALSYYLSVYEMESENCNLNYRIGQCYLNLPHVTGKATGHLLQATKHISPDYLPGSYSTKTAPPFAWLLLGDAYHIEGRLQEASKSYHTFRQYIGTNQDALEALTQRIVGLGIAYEGTVRPEDIVISNLGENVNGNTEEINPVVSGNQKVMAYTRSLNGETSIFISNRDGDSWATATDITKAIGSKEQFKTVAISFFGDKLFLVNNDEYDKDLFVTKLKKGKWSKASRFDRSINSYYHEVNATLSKNEDTIIFSSNRPGGEGSYDLYLSYKEKGKWTEPQNMGNKINTPKEENYPFLNAKGTMLYFCSDGHETVGNIDVLFSMMDRHGNWQYPVNMGLPYNSAGDDVSISYFDSTKTAYMARYNTQNDYDIFKYQYVKNAADVEDNIAESISEPVVTPEIADTTSSDNLAQEITEEPDVDIERLQHEIVADTEEPLVAQHNIEPETHISDVSVEGAENPTPRVERDTLLAVNNSRPIDEVTHEEVAVSSGQPENEVVETNILASDENVAGNMADEPETIISNEALNQEQNNPNIDSPQEIDNYNVRTETPALFNNEQALPSTLVSKGTPKDEGGNYTIQLMALVFPESITYFSNLGVGQIKMSLGKDGFHRYTYGQFKTKKEAQKELRWVKKNGYRDAFVRNIHEISNF